MKFKILIFSILLLLLNCLNAEKSMFDSSTPSGFFVSGLNLNVVQSVVYNAAPSTAVVASGTSKTNSIVVNWNTVADAESYKIYYKTSTGVTNSDPFVTSTTNSVTISGLTNFITYYVKVEPVNPLGSGPLSNEISAVPAVVSTITFTGSGNQKAFLYWTKAPIADCTYKVYYNTVAGFTKTTAGNTVLNIANDFTSSDYYGNKFAMIGSLTNGTTYYFAVETSCPDGMMVYYAGSLSDPVSITPAASAKYDIFVSPDKICSNGGSAACSIGQNNLYGLTQKDLYCTQKSASYGTTNGGIYKALLASSTRFPGSADWVLYPSAKYTRSDSIDIGDTKADGTFTIALGAFAGIEVISGTPKQVWTGMDSSMGNSGTNCSDWTTASTGGGTIGYANGPLENFNKAGEWITCSQPAYIYCVRQ